MKSWKMMTGGILMAIGSWSAGQVETPWLWKLGPLFQSLGGLFMAFGRDNNVPSEAITSASKTAEKLKGDTNPPFVK